MSVEAIPEIELDGPPSSHNSNTTEPSSARARLTSAIVLDESLANESRLGPDVHMALVAHGISSVAAKILRSCNVHPTSRNVALEQQVYRLHVLVHRLWGYIVMPWKVSESYYRELHPLLAVAHQRLQDTRKVTDYFEHSSDVVRCTRDAMFERVLAGHGAAIESYCDQFVSMLEKYCEDSNVFAVKMMSKIPVVTGKSLIVPCQWSWSRVQGVQRLTRCKRRHIAHFSESEIQRVQRLAISSYFHFKGGTK
jgi:hypothetical protein